MKLNKETLTAREKQKTYFRSQCYSEKLVTWDIIREDLFMDLKILKFLEVPKFHNKSKSQNSENAKQLLQHLD